MNHKSPTTEESAPTPQLLIPPSGIFSKFAYYTRRYGVLHALLSYVGRKWPKAWTLLGPPATRRKLRNWLASPSPLILNLGGGGLLAKEWLTADITPRADVYMDLSKPLPLPSRAIDGVYAEEVIEHLDRSAGQKMLTESFRVLKAGGTLRLTTPSLDYFAQRAQREPGAIQEVNDIFYCHGHKFIYSEEALRRALSEAGFINVKKSRYRDPDSRYGSFDSHPARFAFAPPEWSQYWEAEKP